LSNETKYTILLLLASIVLEIMVQAKSWGQKTKYERVR
jgi:hypothetical protein